MRSSGWWLHLVWIKSSSNLCLDMPVIPNWGAGRYFDHAVVLHNDARVVNSNFVVRMSTPKNFNNSLASVSFRDNLRSWRLVQRTISVNCFGGNIKRKNSRGETSCVRRTLTPGVNASPTELRTLHIRFGTIPFNGGSSIDALTHSTLWTFASVSVAAAAILFWATSATSSSPGASTGISSRAISSTVLFSIGSKGIWEGLLTTAIEEVAFVVVAVDEFWIPISVTNPLTSIASDPTCPAFTDLEFKEATLRQLPPRV